MAAIESKDSDIQVGNSRREAVRHLLQINHIRDCLVLSKQTYWHNSLLVGLQTAIATAIALPLVVISPWPHLLGYASLGALVGLFGRFAAKGGRNRSLLIATLCQTLGVFVISCAVWLGLPAKALLALLAAICGIFVFVVIIGRCGLPGPVIFIFAAGAAMSPADNFYHVIERTAATGIVALFTWLICVSTEHFRHVSSSKRTLPSEPLVPVKNAIATSIRAIIAAALSIFIAEAMGAHYPVWAAMGSLTVMQATYLHINITRALQRMIGSIMGGALIALFLPFAPSVWICLGILAVMLFAAEAMMGINYALGQTLLTPMALLITHLATPNLESNALAMERIMDTALGAIIGMAIAITWSTMETRRNLAEHVANHSQ